MAFQAGAFQSNAWQIISIILPSQIEFIGDGVGKGRERADDERLKRERDLKSIIAKSFEAVTGEALSPSSAKATPAQRQTVAKRTFKAIEAQGFDITLREIERMVRQYESDLADLAQTIANDNLRAEDELMMVMLLA